MAEMPHVRPELKPLKLSCDHAECEQGLHCFRESRRRASAEEREPGSCQQCGARLVDWSRMHKRDRGDTAHTFIALRREWIRHRFWHADIDQRAMNYALRKGRRGLPMAMDSRLRSAIGVKHSRDGQQTPWSGNILYYAQHATASCCRRCLQYWHGIPEDRPLTDDEIEYFVDLGLRYIFERIPDLPDEGQKVARIPRR
jgi:hypothetical protein